MEKNTVWAIVDSDGMVCTWTISDTRKAVIEFITENWSMTWKTIKRRGFRCAKFRLTEVEGGK